MAVLQVTVKEFKEKQRSFLDLVDKGTQIVIRRGKKKSYTITAVEDEDMFFTSEMLVKIDLSIQEAKEGKVKTFSTKEELHNFLNAL